MNETVKLAQINMQEIQLDFGPLPDAIRMVVQATIKEVRDWLNLKTSTGIYSFGLLMELVHHQVNQQYNVHIIYDEIAVLEDTSYRESTTKMERQFQHLPLRGLWYKHHHQASFIAQNLLNELMRSNDVEDVLKPHIGETFTDELLRKLTHRITIGAFDRRSCEKRITGEWIVFERSGQQNYYLTLANHNEGDVKIKERIDRYRKLDSLIRKSNLDVNNSNISLKQ